MMTRQPEKWEPPLTAGELKNLRDAVRRWRPFDGTALLDDISDVIDEVPPAEEDLDDLAQRLRGHLMQLVDIASANEAGQKDETAASLIEQARSVRSEELPGDYRTAVGLLRRMAWSASELHERLGDIQALKKSA
ncbi:DUF6415 family natural product biosynthesis protein [Streptomyces sp. NPDC045431]|uniref:DUF6415 family natural product biosynthesis protein n=1 Tax=Streptomyces sp. NPDC045431 TaxID=3155613 RepID=UPI003401E69A